MQIGWPSVALSTDEKLTRDASTTVMPPLPSTSSVSSGPMVVGERRDQPAEPVALAEMLVDDEAVGQAEAGCEPHAARDRRRAVVAEGDHVFRQDAGAGAGAADRDTAGILCADEFRDRGAAEQRRQAQLVAAGEKDAARLRESLEASRFLAVAARVEVHHVDAARAEFAEQLFVARAGLVRAARGRDHDDVGVAAAGDAHETLEDARVVFLVLGATDRDDVAARFAFGDPARAHGGFLSRPARP
jgi:hypothetical protein